MSLRLHDVRYRAGGQEILKGVSLHARRGEVYGFLGHNGAGKTTAMRLVLGLLRPASGAIEVDGFDAARHPREARARLGGLIEAPGFYREWSGVANLRAFARLRGLGFRDAREEAERCFERVGLAYAGRKRFGVYSQGMRQRLGIAQALLGAPPYLLLDEPTNGLDPEAIHELKLLLRSLAVDDGCAVVLSSHQLAEVQGLCHRVGILRQGEMLVEDEVATLASAVDARWTLRAEDEAAALAALRAQHLPAEVDRELGLLLTLGDRRSSAVLRSLVEAGVAVQSFAPRPITLESVYLRATHGELRRVPSSASMLELREPSERRADAFGTLRVLRHELSRSASPRHLLFVAALPCAIAVLSVWQRARASARDAAEVAQGSLASATQATAFEAFGLALTAALPWLALVLALQASQVLAGEASRGTLRTLAQQPLARLELALGKLLGVLFALVASTAAVMGCAMAAAAHWFDFGDLVEVLPNGQNYALRTAEEVWPEWRRLALLPLLPLLVHSLAGFGASVLFRGAVAALVASLGAWLVFDLGWGFARDAGVEAWWPTTYGPRLSGDVSELRRYLDFAQGASTLAFHYAATALQAPLAWAGALVALAL
ncbi:MAG: ATP-binding cassette domain-containing protein, partial [Planctomycetes bacterium]|nr:ATP-binding cassette domain-containing protein [Planctomycetota bacterium]